MHNSIDPWRVLALATILCAVLLAGCGGSSPSSTATTGSEATTPASSAARATATTTSSSTASPALAFAKCMRANGVSNFPDPSSAGGAQFRIPAGGNGAAPAFRAAQAKCQKLLGGGLPAFGSTTHPSAQTLAKLLKIARCMRQHGVPQFPDPTTTIPSNPAVAGITEITNFDNAVLLFPATMNMQAPAYRQALAACGAPPLGLHH